MATATGKFAPLPGYSRNAINRAGEHLRRWPGDLAEAPPDAFTALIAFRESFQTPLTKTAMGLRSMVCTECGLERKGVRVPVAQRLKRREQIGRKLTRFQQMQLWTMGDIGGCRAVLPTRQHVDGVLRRIRKNWNVQGRVRDYRDEPTENGYRARST
jgi:putative GTP pyrophosphokinase